MFICSDLIFKILNCVGILVAKKNGILISKNIPQITFRGTKRLNNKSKPSVLKEIRQKVQTARGHVTRPSS